MYAMKEVEQDDADVEAELRSSRLDFSKMEHQPTEFKVENHYKLLGVTGVEDLL